MQIKGDNKKALGGFKLAAVTATMLKEVLLEKKSLPMRLELLESVIAFNATIVSQSSKDWSLSHTQTNIDILQNASQSPVVPQCFRFSTLN